MKRLNSILASIGLAVGLSNAAFAADDDWAPVAQALGRSGAQLPGGIYRVGLGRSDLKVTVDEVTIRPTLALGSYLAFQKMGSEAMVMGDLVLLHEEVNPVMKKLVEGGIGITALHNHLLRSSPATMPCRKQDPIGGAGTGRFSAAARPRHHRTRSNAGREGQRQ